VRDAGNIKSKVYKDGSIGGSGEEKMGEWGKVLERYEGREQHDFLSMSRGEWLEFVGALEEVAGRRPYGWQEVETFLRLKGLYVYLDLEDLRYAAPDLFRNKRLYEVAIEVVGKIVGMEVIAAVQPPTFGLDGRAYAWPPREERKLLRMVEGCKLYEELALALMREYGPCVLIDADDHTDYALLAARPRALS
jgi:hypothetical protein